MDSKAAAAYLNGPLYEPEPSQETGPGTHFVRPDESTTQKTSASPTTASPKITSSPTGNSVNSQPGSNSNPFRRSNPPSPVDVTKSKGVTTHVRQVSRDSTYNSSPHHHSPLGPNGSPRQSPRSSKFPEYREAALGDLNDSPPARRSHDHNRPPPYDEAAFSTRRRGSSLKERYPGDESVKPLDIIRRDSKKANRSPHLNKRHIPGADLIDRLDPTINKIPYHHEGPYDAALLARNTGPAYASPIAALKDSNEEALRATAPESVEDAVRNHRPIAGVADVPPGMTDKMGRTYNYEEGPNQMFEGLPGGEAYKRYEDVEYDDDDIHGQGPSHGLDRALRNHTIHERDFDGHRGIEMTDRPLMKDHDGKGHGKSTSRDERDPIAIAGDDARYTDLEHTYEATGSGQDAHNGLNRSGSKSFKDGLKRRIGSIRKHNILEEILP